MPATIWDLKYKTTVESNHSIYLNSKFQLRCIGRTCCSLINASLAVKEASYQHKEFMAHDNVLELCTELEAVVANLVGIFYSESN